MKDWLFHEIGRFFRPKSFVSGGILGIFLLGTFFWQWPDENLHLVVCDVGQGDAILLTKGSAQILVDGGPNDKVLDCLGRHLPFWERTIEVVVLTHPQADHMNGLLSVLRRYSVKYFVTGPEANQTQGYKELISILAEKGIPVRNLFSGDRISVGNLRGIVIWPEKKWVYEHMAAESGFSEDAKNELSGVEKSGSYQSDLTTIAEKSRSMGLSSEVVLGKSATADLNSFGVVLEVIDREFRSLLMADVDSAVDDEVLKTGLLGRVDILKYPHHGSRTGATKEFLKAVDPSLAIISVGRGNSYGHPGQETLDLLRSLEMQYLRTDEKGDVEVGSDGQKWWIK